MYVESEWKNKNKKFIKKNTKKTDEILLRRAAGNIKLGP